MHPTTHWAVGTVVSKRDRYGTYNRFYTIDHNLAYDQAWALANVADDRVIVPQRREHPEHMTRPTDGRFFCIDGCDSDFDRFDENRQREKLYNKRFAFTISSGTMRFADPAYDAEGAQENGITRKALNGIWYSVVIPGPHPHLANRTHTWSLILAHESALTLLEQAKVDGKLQGERHIRGLLCIDHGNVAAFDPSFTPKNGLYKHTNLDSIGNEADTYYGVVKKRGGPAYGVHSDAYDGYCVPYGVSQERRLVAVRLQMMNMRRFKRERGPSTPGRP